MRFIFLLLVAGMTGLSSYLLWLRSQASPVVREVASTPQPGIPLAPEEATPAQVHDFCGSCHAYPPPASFPRSEWRREVKQAYDFFRESALPGPFPALESVVKYYESRAPEELKIVPAANASEPCPVAFQPQGFSLPGAMPAAVSNVNLVHLHDPKKLDVLTCDMRSGQVAVLQPYKPEAAWRTLATLSYPAHAEVVDLDGDGIKDIVVACLGNPTPTNARFGSVVWLRGKPDGSYTPFTLLEGVGRVADVQAADFNGDGKLDLVVAVFGWRSTGEIVILENQTKDWAHPVFVPRVVDDRHGTIHVPVCDLNNDGRPDFVALISQEHETVVAFLNDGKGHFHKETIYAAPHPAYGCSGIQLVDLNGDGKLDVLLSNGDVLDPPYLLKPYHGVQWLENQGRFPFQPHPLTDLPGAMRAIAADFDGDGDLDIVAVSYLPAEGFADRAARRLDSIILLEQTTPGQFRRHSLQAGLCDHVTCAAGDLFGDGVVHLVTGNFFMRQAPPNAEAVTIWKNRHAPRQR